MPAPLVCDRLNGSCPNCRAKIDGVADPTAENETEPLRRARSRNEEYGAVPTDELGESGAADLGRERGTARAGRRVGTDLV
eukprot:scaffold362_cov246-Pinguiococcus_pyrenoidosus.AAC.5